MDTSSARSRARSSRTPEGSRATFLLAGHRARGVDPAAFFTPAHLATARGLPVLWVFDAHGARVLTLETGDVGEIRAALEPLLDAPE